MDDDGNSRLYIIQKKTKEAISLPLSQEAIKQLPKREFLTLINKFGINLCSLYVGMPKQFGDSIQINA